MNLLDKAIGYFSPQAALRRAWARQNLTRAYDGAKTGRRNAGWVAAGAGPNTEIGTALSILRNRSSDIVRNTPAGAKALRTLANAAVGTGIAAESKAKGKARRDLIDELWESWAGSTACDLRRNQNFGGLQRLSVRGMCERGDTLIRRWPLPANSDRPLPLAIQVLEGDYLDLTKTANNNNPVIQGIEIDQLTGERLAYWLYQVHPADWVGGFSKVSMQSVRVPASDIIHLFEEDRPGQMRGVPRLASILQTMRDLGDYDEAELVRKKIEACYVAMITSPSAANGGPLIGTPAGKTTDAAGNAVETVEPGMIGRLLPGEDVKFGNPDIASGVAEFHKDYDRRIAAGIGVMYEQLTGDLSNVNYSSFRAGHLEFRNDIECLRDHVIEAKLCAGVWRWFIDASVMAGKIDRADYAVEWTPPAWQSVDPEKDANADLKNVRAGFVTPQKVVAANGGKFDRVVEDIKAANAAYDAAGIVTDSDPRKTKMGGNAQQPNDKPGA